MNRERIGKGWEHKVYRSKKHPGFVFKIPRTGALLLSGFSVPTIKKEYEEGFREVRHVDLVEIPKIRVFDVEKLTRGRKKGYILAQQYKPEDLSIKDIRKELKNTDSKYLLNQFDVSCDNFASHDNKIQWYDPFHGYNRIIEKLTPLSYKQFIGLKASVVRVVRRVKDLTTRNPRFRRG